MTCPACQGPMSKVLYAGIPARLCAGTCTPPLLTGPGSWIIAWLPFNGFFLSYTGAYWRALWHFLTDPDLVDPPDGGLR